MRPLKIDFDNQMITFPEAEIIEKFPVALGVRMMPVATSAATCYAFDRRAHMKKRTKALLILLALLLLLTLPGFYNGLIIHRYTVEAPSVAGPVRIALITDLHSCA